MVPQERLALGSIRHQYYDVSEASRGHPSIIPACDSVGSFRPMTSRLLFTDVCSYATEWSGVDTKMQLFQVLASRRCRFFCSIEVLLTYLITIPHFRSFCPYGSLRYDTQSLQCVCWMILDESLAMSYAADFFTAVQYNADLSVNQQSGIELATLPTWRLSWKIKWHYTRRDCSPYTLHWFLLARGVFESSPL